MLSDRASRPVGSHCPCEYRFHLGGVGDGSLADEAAAEVDGGLAIYQTLPFEERESVGAVRRRGIPLGSPIQLLHSQ